MHQLPTDFDIQLFAMNNYFNIKGSTLKEFKQDIAKIHLLKKMTKRWKDGGNISLGLYLNYFIILFNVFETKALNVLLFYHFGEEYWPEVKTVLLFLNRLSIIIPELNINTLEIPINDILYREFDQI